MPQLGFVGLGMMGGRMVSRLIDKGHSVTGYNRTRSKAQWLIDKGMVWADSPRAVAERSEIVLTMLTDSGAVREVTHGPDGLLEGLGAGKVLIEMSTISP